MEVATNLFTSLDDFIINRRDKFDYFESSAKEKNLESDYKDLSQRTRGRSSRQAFLDGSAPSLASKTAIEFLQGHKSSVWFFSRLKTLNSEELKQSCKEFVEIYYEDVSEKELEMQCLHLTEYLKIAPSSENEEANSLSGISHLQIEKNKK
ncbi:hypothetical protein ILUMI_24906 [Ignelater luminosus]|uniref:Uncharacterized protein n=1 Tax=Ignelater luminosus TaxID=2038154 RepID=A0A8K0C9L0_IGNLU|nr:hypothetical protein ILUMI_24906 [Ignelater luminosus]